MTSKVEDQIWFRGNTEAVSANDDGALWTLVRDAQGGDEVAMAGVLVAMKARRAKLARRFGNYVGCGGGSAGTAADSYEAMGNYGSGWIDSMMAMAVAAFDCDQHTERVAYRLYLDTRYLLALPGNRRRTLLFGSNQCPETEQDFHETIRAVDDVEADAVGVDEEWLRAQLWDLGRGRESQERFADVVDGIVHVWLHGSTYAQAAACAGVGVDSLKFYLRRCRLALATDEVRAQLVG